MLLKVGCSGGDLARTGEARGAVVTWRLTQPSPTKTHSGLLVATRSAWPAQTGPGSLRAHITMLTGCSYLGQAKIAQVWAHTCPRTYVHNRAPQIPLFFLSSRTRGPKLHWGGIQPCCGIWNVVRGTMDGDMCQMY